MYMARANPRLIYIVLDGGCDGRPDGETSLERADTPNLDLIARRAKAGLVHVLGMGVAPQSDAATLSLLGYSPYRYRVGRGVLEALGLGVKLAPQREIALRGNLATVDETGWGIIDRRCGRDVSSEEARELLRDLSEVDLGIYGGYAKALPSKGHRVVVIIGSRDERLSPEVSNMDPAYRRVGYISEAVSNPGRRVLPCEPLSSDRSALVAAELVNRFYELSHKHLESHPLNEDRRRSGRLPCNAILVRDAGSRPEDIPMFQHRFGFKMASVVEMPVERGIAELIGLVIADVDTSGTRAARYVRMADRAVDILEYADGVYVHLKGPDEPAHDGDLSGKVEALEDIDQYFLGRLLDRIDLSRTAIVVTCDHCTSPRMRSHTSDPVPLIIYKYGFKNDGLYRFTEREAGKGSIGVLTGGWDVLPLVKRLVWGG